MKQREFSWVGVFIRPLADETGICGSTMTSNKADIIKKQALLPGFEEGHYEPRHNYDKALINSRNPDELLKRDHRVSIRVSGQDLKILQRRALEAGIPTQSLLATIIQEHVREAQAEEQDAVEALQSQDVLRTDAANEPLEPARAGAPVTTESPDPPTQS